MKKEYFKVVFPSVLTMVLILVLLFCSGGLTFGWFAKNSEVAASGMSIGVTAENNVSVANYQVYKRDGATNSAQLILNSESSEYATKTKEQLQFEMTEYDTVFTDRNVNTPIVIRVELKDLQRGDDTTPPISVEITCPENHFTEQQTVEGTPRQVLSDYMSNIISVRCGTIHSLDGENVSTGANSIYEGVINNFKTVGETSFVIMTASSYYKISTISFLIENYTLTEDDTLVVYFEFNYAEANIEQYLNEHEINVDATASAGAPLEDMIRFYFDLNSLSFRYAEEKK